MGNEGFIIWIIWFIVILEKMFFKIKNTQPVTSGAVSSAIANNGLLTSLQSLGSNAYILYPTNYRQYTMPDDGILFMSMIRNTDGYSCYVARNGTTILYFDAWRNGVYTGQIKVKKNDIIRISQNSVDNASRWLIGNLLLLK